MEKRNGREGADFRGIWLALLAAALYALGTPFSKLLLQELPPTLTAGFLYLGAGICMLTLSLLRRLTGRRNEERLSRRELPFTVLMILLDIAAPVLLMWGLRTAGAAEASLLGNFEIVATALIALAVFREAISPRLFAGILFVTLSCALLSVTDLRSFRFSGGAALVLGAATLWGLENNCTRKISSKDPLQIVLLKGIGSGAGALVTGLLLGERTERFLPVLFALLLGAVAYGLSIYCYVYAQRRIGAARTSAFYAVCPFIGVLLSLLIFRELPGRMFIPALCLMLLGAWLCSGEGPLFRRKKHE